MQQHIRVMNFEPFANQNPLYPMLLSGMFLL